MQRIHIDYVEIEGYQVLVIIDIHSKWIEAIPLRTAIVATTIEALRRLFASFGLPKEIISDNGPQFVATEFITFCKKNGIKNVCIPAYHPASNGAAERALQEVKQATKKMGTALMLGITLARFLLMYHTTQPVISVFPQLVEMEGIHSREENEEKRMAKNEKERERVARLEPVYQILASKVPRHQSAHLRGRKRQQSRIFTLKSALTYIKHLKSLVWLLVGIYLLYNCHFVHTCSHCDIWIAHE